MRILAALSGGVDSAVAAARLAREGAEVVGVHLRTGVEAEAGAAGHRSCCGADDARDARLVASRLGLPFYVVDVAEAFGGVIEDFVASYAAGRTPNPCVLCNRSVKFGRLLEIARGLGCESVATGHYARAERAADGRHRLLRARDGAKDQSYVLSQLDQAQLAAARFPLGEATKDAVRDEARALALTVADKPDSQELCFVPGGDYRSWLARHAPEALVPGPIVDDATGRQVGRHAGAAGFTLGQRRGLPPQGEPRYVTGIDAATATVRIGGRAAARRREVGVGGLNWIDEPEPPAGARRDVVARVRHVGGMVAATLEVAGPGRGRVRFEAPVFAPSPGQALVAYVREAVLCGGAIEGPGAPTAG